MGLFDFLTGRKNTEPEVTTRHESLTRQEDGSMKRERTSTPTPFIETSQGRIHESDLADPAYAARVDSAIERLREHGGQEAVDRAIQTYRGIDAGNFNLARVLEADVQRIEAGKPQMAEITGEAPQLEAAVDITRPGAFELDPRD
jgi:hypothetical protein